MKIFGLDKFCLKFQNCCDLLMENMCKFLIVKYDVKMLDIQSNVNDEMVSGLKVSLICCNYNFDIKI